MPWLPLGVGWMHLGMPWIRSGHAIYALSMRSVLLVMPEACGKALGAFSMPWMRLGAILCMRLAFWLLLGTPWMPLGVPLTLSAHTFDAFRHAFCL